MGWGGWDRVAKNKERVVGWVLLCMESAVFDVFDVILMFRVSH